MNPASKSVASAPGYRIRWPSLPGFSAARQRLAILYILAAGPLLVLIAIGAWVDRAQALKTAQTRAESIAQLGATQQDDMVQEAENLLSILALVPEVRTMGEACHSTLRKVEEAHARIITVSVFRTTGESACNSRQEHPTVNVGDRDYFQRTLVALPGASVVSEILTSRISGRPTMVIAQPMRDTPDGPPVAVLSAGLNLDWFPHLSERLSGTPDTIVELIDLRSGQVAARSNDPSVGAMSRPADPQLLAAIKSSPGGGSVETGVDGAAHTVGFAPLPGTEMRMALAVALPKTEVLAPSNYHLTLNALGFLGAAIAAVLLAWLAADRSLLRPIHQMVAAAAAIGSGDLTVHIGRPRGAVRELATLAADFDAMTQRLRAREERIAAMGERIAQSEEHHRLLANNVGDMIARFDQDFTRTYMSPACRDVLGYEPDAMVGQPMPEVVIEEDRARVRTELVRPLLTGADTARCRYRVRQKGGRVIWLETFGRRLPDGAGFVTVARDVSVQKALEEQLEAANHQLRIQVMQDPLTGIANRRRFDEMLGFEFRRAQRLQEPLSLLMVDIDHFKSFNDTYGHSVGDECLRAVATALDRALRRPGDLVGRYGGEEFAILLPGTPPAGVLTVAERIRTEVAHTARHGCSAIAGPLTVSIGATTIMPPIETGGPAILIETADAALYDAKHNGRNCVRVAVIASTALYKEPEPSFA